MLVKNSFILPFFLAGSVCISATTSAETVEAEGRWFIDRNTTIDQACKQALLKSQAQALAKLGLEIMSIAQEEICSDVEDDVKCVLYQDIMNSTPGGYIREYTKTEEVVEDEDKEGKWCVIKIRAEVEKYKEDRDPNFILHAKLNKRIFVEDTGIEITGDTNKESYIYVLGWYPEIDPAVYTKLYPNAYEKDKLISGEFMIPSREGKKKYELPTEFSDKLKGDRTYESLIVIASKEKIPLLDQERRTHFESRLNTIGRENWVKLKLGYVIVRRDDL